MYSNVNPIYIHMHFIWFHKSYLFLLLSILVEYKKIVNTDLKYDSGYVDFLVFNKN